MPPIVQISFTQTEYDELENRAGDCPPALYIKGIIFPDNDFRRWFPQLITRVDLIQDGTEFNIRAAMGTDWVNIPKGIKLALGRVFYQHVAAGNIAGVEPTEADSAKTQWYRKG